MATGLIIISVLVSIFLILIVLVQNPKGGGLTANLTSQNQMFGVKRTTDFLEKGTWILAMVILSISILSTFISNPNETKNNTTESEIEVPAANIPNIDYEGLKANENKENTENTAE